MYSSYVKVFGAMLIPNIGGLVSGYSVTRKNLENWYHKLKLPTWRPPNWVFGPVWTTLYSSMGYASYLVYRDGGGFTGDAKLPLIAYGTQLALNFAWSPIFFGQHNIKGGLINILALTATATTTGILFYNVNSIAGHLFVPYIIWLSFASYLNYSIWKLNSEGTEKIKAE